MREQSDIYSYCLDLLRQRAYSTFKLKRKLKQKKYPENEIVLVSKILQSEGYLRDDLYAEARARTWMLKGDSAFQIKRKLQKEGLSLDELRVAALFEEESQNEDLQIRKLVEAQLRKVKKLPSDKNDLYKLKQKIMAAVMRKGHSFAGVKAVLDEFSLKQ